MTPAEGRRLQAAVNGVSAPFVKSPVVQDPRCFLKKSIVRDHASFAASAL
jgi:hypothetical protein